jgi:hypothetical protein
MCYNDHSKMTKFTANHVRAYRGAVHTPQFCTFFRATFASRIRPLSVNKYHAIDNTCSYWRTRSHLAHHLFRCDVICACSYRTHQYCRASCGARRHS